ncbi:MAG: Uma2 family endonuclease [Chloroherpetonaceae bacterium]|nr:Uma2 family endonuclease [Chloroherpetonaceae bacterium]MDW8436780.1 Uma2 family endonuclease [Chloroherpetonaceae bacterium]
METLVKKMTYAEFRELDFPDDDRHLYELLDGEPVQRNTPSIQHQRIARNVFRKLDQFVLEKNLGEVFFAPVTLLVDDYNAPQPDLAFISNKTTDATDEFVVVKAPDLVVEILSPSTMSDDRHRKRKLYERFGVKEYWLIDPQNKAIEVLELLNGQFELFSFAAEKGKVRSKILEGFELNLSDAFST